MKNRIVVLLLLSTQLGLAQRQEQIDIRKLARYVQQDINFWHSYASVHLQQTRKPLVHIGLSTDDWVRNQCNGKQFAEMVSVKVPMVDSNGIEIISKKVVPLPSYMVFLDGNAFDRKIGFAYTEYDGTQEYIKHFFFAGYDDWKKINGLRKSLFIDLLLSMPKERLADSIVDITVNGKKERMLIFALNNYSCYDESPDAGCVPSKLVRFLLDQYDQQMTALYYSGKEKACEIKVDEWGYVSMQSIGVQEEHVTVYDENGVEHIQKIKPVSLQTNAILLYYERPSSPQKRRLIYPGVRVPVQTSTGLVLGNRSTYLPDHVKARFSKPIQALLNYLIEINQ